MLVLTRRVGESIVIGGDIEVTVLDIKGESIRIGVEAPRETSIQRAEILAAVGEENAAAAAASVSEDAIADAVLRSRRSRTD